MAKLKRNDFVEIEYTGRLKEDNLIFDTTDEKIAKDNALYNERQAYGPVVICIGEKQVLAGIDEQLEGKETENRYTLQISPEQGFGKKNAKLIQLINTSKFRQQGIAPVPGLQVNIDGMMGIVRTVTGGRTLVDFNHPLSGRELAYDINVNNIVTDDKRKIEEYLKLQLSQQDVKATVIEGNATVELQMELPKEIQKKIGEKISELIPTVKKVEFIRKKEEKKEANEEKQEVQENKESKENKQKAEEKK